MEVKITKTIISNSREFKIGYDINFTYLKNNKEYLCFGIIEDIAEDTFKISNVMIDQWNVSDILNIKYTEVKDGILRFTDNGAY